MVSIMEYPAGRAEAFIVVTYSSPKCSSQACAVKVSLSFSYFELKDFQSPHADEEGVSDREQWSVVRKSLKPKSPLPRVAPR